MTINELSKQLSTAVSVLEGKKLALDDSTKIAALASAEYDDSVEKVHRFEQELHDAIAALMPNTPPVSRVRSN